MQESPSKVESLTPRAKRLIYRSWHRGTKEMDLLLGRFADTYIPEFNEAQLDQYEDLLELNDPDLYNWYTGQVAMPEEFQNEVMELFLAFNYKTS